MNYSMISLDARLEDIATEINLKANHAIIGESCLEKFDTIHLRISKVQGVGWRSVWVGEADDPVVTTRPLAATIDATRAIEDYEGLRVIFVHDPRPAIVIVRTTGGTTPIFLSSHKGRVVASWRFEVAAEALPKCLPDVDACRLFLAHSQGRTRDQVIKGITMLWPGEVATFDQNGLSYENARTPEVVRPSALIDNARVTDAFLELIANAVRPSVQRSRGAAIELSGGLDSSCVAIAATRVRSGLKSYGAIQPGVTGQQQRRRRQELVDLLGLDDREGFSTKPTPTRSLDVAECQITPFDDLYRMPCMAALENHAPDVIDTVVTGIGGDELTKEYSLSRPDWELAGIQSSSASVAAASRADMFMRRGIWPVNPLVSIPVVNFCRALPEKLRASRQLNTLTLARAGLSDGFLFPRYYEHFGNVLTQESIDTDYDEIFRRSVLADYRITDISVILSEARDATLRGISWELISKVYNMAKLEYVLRRYVS